MQRLMRTSRRMVLASFVTALAWVAASFGGAAMARGADDIPGLKRLDPKQPLWLDAARKRVVMVGEVCLREGQLEMLVCPRGSKEHESVLSVPVEPYKVHAALLAVGAEPGNPARFVPDYQPARGTQIDVWLFWTDEQGNRQRARAQDWVRHFGTQKSLEQSWVFGGSGFWVDETTGKKHYQAEQGDFICVSNFPTAMLDLPIESSDKAGQLAFDAFTERIPPLGTKVTIVLKPVLKGNAAKVEEGGEDAERSEAEAKDE
ncbi:MAG TPA: YdjY domain-containing protein [Pirellulales bacterium]|nr:YdjY domain-containing protein [Pirellulales bacterium]